MVSTDHAILAGFITWKEARSANRDPTPAQVTVAWLLTRGDDIPIPGTKRVTRRSIPTYIERRTES